MARDLCSADDEERRESAAAWRRGMGGLDLWRQYEAAFAREDFICEARF